MKIIFSAFTLLLASAAATNAAETPPSADRELRGYSRSSYIYGGAASNTYRSGSYGAAAATCDSTLGHCAEEICDIVSYNCAVGGAAGAQGPAGKPGAIGAAGLDGRNGIDGKQGPMGPMGPAGAPGLKGDTGPQGLQGLPGEQGPPGYPGVDGLNGLPGVPGKDGAIGPRGAQGEKGDRGPQGPQGPAGPPGAAAAQLAVTQTCESVSSLGDGVAMASCNSGLAGGATVTCPRGYEMTGCNGISQDSSPLAVSCYIEGNTCVCDGCDLAGGKSYYPPKLTAQARCCQVSHL